MIHFDFSDLMTMGGYLLGSYSTGYLFGWIHLTFTRTTEKI